MIVWIGMLIATAASIYWARRVFELEAEAEALAEMIAETVRDRDEAYVMIDRLSDR
jgi:hypothetical protein